MITQLVQLESRCCVHVKTQKRPFPTTVMAHHNTTSPAASESLLSVGPCTNKEETALVCAIMLALWVLNHFHLDVGLALMLSSTRSLQDGSSQGKPCPKRILQIYICFLVERHSICIGFYRAKFCKKIPGCGDHSWTTGCSTNMLWKTALIHVYSLLLWQWTWALG